MPISQSRKTNRIQPIIIDRLNPQFIGIAQKYSEHKKDRLESQDKRKKVNSNYIYAINFNKQLEKNLKEKTMQLEKLQGIRERHYNDIAHKMELQAYKQKQQEKLRNKCQTDRMSLKSNIKNAQDSLKMQKQYKKKLVKHQMNQALNEYELTSTQNYQEQCMRHQSIELSKKIANQRINKFHKNQNLKSLNNYKKMILQQREKSAQNKKDIKQKSKQLIKLDQSISQKQNKLKNIVDEISLYSVQTSRQRKVNHLMNNTISTWGYNDLNDDQSDYNGSKSKPKKKNKINLKSRLHTNSSQRSRPSQILRKSLKDDREKFNSVNLNDSDI